MDIHDVLDRWTSVFCEYSYNNERYAQMCLHLVLGQVWKYRYIKKGAQRLDGRISIAAFWDSSGGKSAPYGFVKRMLDVAGLDTYDLDDFTDAGLIGTWVESEEEEGGLELSEGTLQMADCVHFDEASTLFMETTHTKKAINFLEKGLNPMGTPQNMISKKLAQGPPIEFYSNFSLYLTSYIPEGLGEEFLNKGLMQRVLMLAKKLLYVDRVDNIRTDADKLGRDSVVPEEFKWLEDYVESIAQDEQIRVRNDLPHEFEWDNIREYVKTRNVRLLAMVQNLDSGIQSVAASIISRYVNFMYVIATHSASVRGDLTITKEDVDYSYEFIHSLMVLILPFLEMDAQISRKGGKENKLARDMKRIYNKLASESALDEGWVLKSQLWHQCEMELHISSSTLYRATRESEWLVEATINRKKYIKIA